MKEELRKLYQEYKQARDEVGLWSNEASIEGFIRWLLTGNL